MEVGLAVDLGATKVAVARAEGTVSARLPVGGVDDEVRWLGDWLSGIAPRSVSRVVLSCAAEIDTSGHVRRWPNRPHWVGIPLREVLEARFAAAVRIVPDGSAAALGESHQRGLTDLVYLGLGTGVCGGVIRSGLIPLDDQWVLDAGHLLVEPNGPVCRCGGHGCLQALSSAPAVREQVAGVLGRRLSWDEIVQAFDDIALQPFRDRLASSLALASVNLAAIFGVSDVVIGGRVVDRLPQIIRQVRQALPRVSCPPRIHAAVTGADASLVGAAVMAGFRLHNDRRGTDAIHHI